MGLMGLESGSDKACVCRKFWERTRDKEVDDDDKDLLMSDYDVQSQEEATFLIWFDFFGYLGHLVVVVPNLWSFKSSIYG